jgi:hypothetical protein
LRTTAGVFLLLLGTSPIVLADVPDPNRSTVEINGQGCPTQFLFRADGELDRMTVDIVVRDAFDWPFTFCPVEILVTPNAGALAYCHCAADTHWGVTDDQGAASATFAEIGGRGSLDVRVITHCPLTGTITLAAETVWFTSPDLDGSCEDAPASATDVIDLGIWAAGLPPELRSGIRLHV